MRRVSRERRGDDLFDGDDETSAHTNKTPEQRNAWDIWRDLSTESGVVANQDDRQRMIERHKLVVSIIEINSQQLRCESARAGVDFERATALRDAASAGSTVDAERAIAVLDERAASLAAQSQRLVEQRDFLNASLSEFDGNTAAQDARPVGRA